MAGFWCDYCNYNAHAKTHQQAQHAGADHKARKYQCKSCIVTWPYKFAEHRDRLCGTLKPSPTDEFRTWNADTLKFDYHGPRPDSVVIRTDESAIRNAKVAKLESLGGEIAQLRDIRAAAERDGIAASSGFDPTRLNELIRQRNNLAAAVSSASHSSASLSKRVHNLSARKHAMYFPS